MSVADYTGMVRDNFFIRQVRAVDEQSSRPLSSIRNATKEAEQAVRLQQIQVATLCFGPRSGCLDSLANLSVRRAQIEILWLLVQRARLLRSVASEWEQMLKRDEDEDGNEVECCDTQ